jgi:hypothetical protein
MEKASLKMSELRKAVRTATDEADKDRLRMIMVDLARAFVQAPQ